MGARISQGHWASNRTIADGSTDSENFFIAEILGMAATSSHMCFHRHYPLK